MDATRKIRTFANKGNEPSAINQTAEIAQNFKLKSKIWGHWRRIEPRPTGYEPVALPAELQWHLIYAKSTNCQFNLCGAANGTRTRDQQLGRLRLYQLSYCRETFYPGKRVGLVAQCMVRSARLELAHPFGYHHLKVARLPIPPRAHVSRLLNNRHEVKPAITCFY